MGYSIYGFVIVMPTASRAHYSQADDRARRKDVGCIYSVRPVVSAGN
jgi:hypothetical protein